MARRKKAGNGYREWRVDKLQDGLYVVRLAGIHNGRIFWERTEKMQKVDIRGAFMELVVEDAAKRPSTPQEGVG